MLNEQEQKKSGEELIEEGNKLFKQSKFQLSVKSYSQAIQKSNGTSVRALLNRSAAYLKLERFYLAYKDAQLAAQLDVYNEKAYFRMGKAAYQMRQYEKAKNHFETCVELNQSVKEAEIELKKSLQRIDESVTGIYDFESLVEQHMKRKNSNFDVADYKSNKIFITDIPNKSKGVLAIEAIKKGTLLVVSKAVKAAIYNEKSFEVNDFENFSKLITMMQSDPELAKQIYSLYAGPDYSRGEKFNELNVDVKHIESILKYNKFDIVNNIKLGEECDNESGLWLFPSYFNHSCAPNTSTRFLGDLLIMYANQDIKKNEEVTTSYLCGGVNYDKRQEKLFKKYHFQCDCKLCIYDKNEPDLPKRELLLNKIVSKFGNQSKQYTMAEINADINELRKICLNRPNASHFLGHPLIILGSLYESNHNFKNSAKAYEEAYFVSKEKDYMALLCLKKASEAYKKCSNETRSKWCFQTASEYYENNAALFKKLWDIY